MYKDLGVPSARAVHIYKYTTKSETLNSANLIICTVDQETVVS